jgi:hypothetical protein
LPPGFDAAAAVRYPAIVNYYGGTLPIAEDFGGRYPKEWWASRGYLVYVPQPSGATGVRPGLFGNHVNDWGKTTSEEILEGTAAFLAAYPAVDAKRVGCIGASYGGFMTMLLVTKTDRFAAAVSTRGISKHRVLLGRRLLGLFLQRVGIGRSVSVEPERRVRRSLANLRGRSCQDPDPPSPTRADTNVPPGESESFYTALKLTGARVGATDVDAQDHHILDHAETHRCGRNRSSRGLAVVEGPAAVVGRSLPGENRDSPLLLTNPNELRKSFRLPRPSEPRNRAVEVGNDFSARLDL